MHQHRRELYTVVEEQPGWIRRLENFLSRAKSILPKRHEECLHVIHEHLRDVTFASSGCGTAFGRSDSGRPCALRLHLLLDLRAEPAQFVDSFCVHLVAELAFSCSLHFGLVNVGFPPATQKRYSAGLGFDVSARALLHTISRLVATSPIARHSLLLKSR